MDNTTQQVEAILNKHRRAAADEIAATCFGSNGLSHASSNGVSHAASNSVAAAPTKVSAKKPKATKVAKTAKAAKAAKTKSQKAIDKAKGVKRDPAVLEALMESLLKHITANGGQGIEQISKALDKTSTELTLPMKKLLKAKKVGTKGQKRATRYFPK